MPSRRFCTMLLFATICATTACAGGTAVPGGGVPVEQLQRDMRVITPAQMDGLVALNLYEVVQRVHPEWLRSRSTSTTGQRSGLTTGSDTEVQVYIDNQHAGNTELLKSLPVRSATMLRYYSAPEAQQRFGSGNLNGVIQVVTTPPTPSP